MKKKTKKIKANLNTLTKVTLDQNLKLREYEQIIKEYTDTIKQLQQQPTLTKELEKCKIEINQLIEKEMEYKETIEEQLKEIRIKDKIIEDQIQQYNTEGTIPHTRMILEELKKIKNKLETVEENQPMIRETNTEKMYKYQQMDRFIRKWSLHQKGKSQQCTQTTQKLPF